MYVDNRPQLCALFCVCVSFLSLLLLASLCLVNVIFLPSKHVCLFFFFFTNNGGKDAYFYMYLLLILWKSSFCDTRLNRPLFISYFIPWASEFHDVVPTSLWFAFPLWFVLIAFISVSIIGHVFVAAPTKLQFFFWSSGMHKDCCFTGFWKVLSIWQINRMSWFHSFILLVSL